MKEDSIYIVQGKTKSAIINLDTHELRTLTNLQLRQLTDETDLEADLSPYLSPNITIPQKDLLDIHLSGTTDLANVSQHIRKDAAYLNVRLFCSAQPLVTIEQLRVLVRWINNNIFHFGLVIFVPENYDQEQYAQVFDPFRVLLRPPTPAPTTTYTPTFRTTPYAIHISKQHNLYHYSRDTLRGHGTALEFLDHEVYDIPKTAIENCKDCAFRLTCFDPREVQQFAGNYYYTSLCLQELDQ